MRYKKLNTREAAQQIERIIDQIRDLKMAQLTDNLEFNSMSHNSFVAMETAIAQLEYASGQLEVTRNYKAKGVK